jgi:hypothetical protein
MIPKLALPGSIVLKNRQPSKGNFSGCFPSSQAYAFGNRKGAEHAYVPVKRHELLFQSGLIEWANVLVFFDDERRGL